MNKKFLIGALSILLLSSCGSNNANADNFTTVKVLLANERLNDDGLNNNDNIFKAGKIAFEEILKTTKEFSKNAKIDNVKKSFNLSNNTYTWSNSPDYSNYLDFFYSYSDGIEFNAKRGSSLIDNAKNNIRTIDKWIKVNDEEIFLSVDKSSETILSRSNDQYQICKRSQNEFGQNTFEMFIENSSTSSKSRMKYIPGLRYEYTSIQFDSMLVIVADKEKGYWDIMSTSFLLNEEIDTVSFNNLVMKDESIYETNYYLDVSSDDIYEYYNDIKIISSDGKNDILSIDNNVVSLCTTGINNLDSFYINALDNQVIDISENGYPDDMEDYEVIITGTGDEKTYFTIDNSSVIAKFQNGKELKKGDLLYNGAIKVNGTSIKPIGGVDFYGEIELYFENDDVNSILNYLSQMMNDYDFSFKDEYSVIENYVKYASRDALNFKDYYLWHNRNINNINDVKDVVYIEKELIDDFAELYVKFKDYEVINNNSQLSINSNLVFSDLNIVSNGNITNDGFTVSVNNLSIEVKDTSLFDVNREYIICFAFAINKNDEYYNLYPLNLDTTDKTLFNGEENFVLNQSASFNVEMLEEGEYTLVAYVATSEENIRVSKPIAVNSLIVESIRNEDGLINVLNNKNDNIVLTSNKTSEINISSNNVSNYNELYTLLESYAYRHGMLLDSDIEKENNSTWSNVNVNDTITSGKYRLKYYNTSEKIESYVIASI